MLLSGELCQAGFGVTPAATGAQALTCLQAVHFDLNILDVQLPDRDGYAVCAEVRQRECYVPIIMISGNPDIKYEYSQFHADDAIEKPVDIKLLIDKINLQLGRTVTV